MRIDPTIEAQSLDLDLAGGATVARLSRPRLLAAAARVGATLYKRERDLAGLLADRPRGGRALVAALAAAEETANAERLAGSPAYLPGRHVRLLTALMAEAAALSAIVAEAA